MMVTMNSADTSLIRAGYDRWALVYDHDANPLPALEEPFVHEAIGPVTGLAVLDLGCGTGRHALWLAAAVPGSRPWTSPRACWRRPAASRGPRRSGSSCTTCMSGYRFHPGRSTGSSAGWCWSTSATCTGSSARPAGCSSPAAGAVVSAMHPAMFLRGSQARFTDPESGQVVQPGSLAHPFGDIVMAAVRAGFRIDQIGEHAPDADFAARYPRAEKYLGWPMLVVLGLVANKLGV